MQDRKNYWMSSGVGSNPFARTSGMTQPADQSKSVKGFYGNIDFEQESTRTDFRKSVGKDLNIKNPYVEKEFTVSNFSDITQRVVQACRQNQPANGLRGLRVALRKLDENQNGLVHPTDFKFGLKAYGIDITEDEMMSLLKYFDTTRTGFLSVNEMFHAMRSSSMNEKREACVTAAYNKLDRSGNQGVTIACLEANYDCAANPQF